jgi:hypothetical protein
MRRQWCRGSCLFRISFGSGKQLLDALLDGSFRGDFVKRLVLFLDVVVVLIVDMHVSSLNIGKAYVG